MLHYIVLYIEHLQKHLDRLRSAAETHEASKTCRTQGELGVLTPADPCSEDGGYSTLHTEEPLLESPSETSTDGEKVADSESKLLCHQQYSFTKEPTTFGLQLLQHQDNDTHETSASMDVDYQVLGNDGNEDSGMETSMCEQQQEGTIQDKCSPDKEDSVTSQTDYAGLSEATVDAVLIDPGKHDWRNDSRFTDSIITCTHSPYSTNSGTLNGQEEPSWETTQELESSSPSAELFPEDSPWLAQYSTPPHTVLYSQVITVESRSSACVSPEPAQPWLSLSPSLFTSPSRHMPCATLDQHGTLMSVLNEDSLQAEGDISWMVKKNNNIPPPLHELQGQEPEVVRLAPLNPAVNAWHLQPDGGSSQVPPITCEALPKPMTARPSRSRHLRCTPSSYIKQEEADNELGWNSSDDLGKGFVDDCKDQTWTPSLYTMRRGATHNSRRSINNIGGSRHQRVGVVQDKSEKPGGGQKSVSGRKRRNSLNPKVSRDSKHHLTAGVKGRKKCINGFIMFCRLERKKYICQHPDITSTQTTCELARMWREMSGEEKQPFRETAQDFSRQDNRVVKTGGSAILNSPPKVKTETLVTSEIEQVLDQTMENESADLVMKDYFSVQRTRCKKRWRGDVSHSKLHNCPTSGSSMAVVPLPCQSSLQRRSRRAVTRKSSRVQQSFENPHFVVELPESSAEKKQQQKPPC
ncbi:uncharacterized protein LOC116939722 [Petromyzon marinus]|uniref:uncharacterized protein LOC116939722 n=1 Tax=Petromyzon marinus TaxID=7757 RepID=UPI003F6EA4DF